MWTGLGRLSGFLGVASLRVSGLFLILYFCLSFTARDMIVGSLYSLLLFFCADFGSIKGICAVGEGVHLGLLEIQLLSV